MKQRILITMLIATAMSVVGCSKSDTPNTTTTPDDYELSTTEIGFSAEESITKGTPVTAFVSGDSFGVYALYTKDSSDPIIYKSNQEVKNDNGTWGYSPTMYWPTSGSLSFYAYSPYSASTTISQNDSEEPILTYTVAANAIDQDDLLIAKAENKTITSDAVDFSFQHALSMISLEFTNIFEVDIDYYVMKVTNISLCNIMTTASINMATQSVTASDTGNVSALLSSGSLEDIYLEYNEAKSITTDNGYFFIPPQTLGSDATISIQVELYKVAEGDDTDTTYDFVSEYVASKSFADYSLAMGKQYTMTLEYGDSLGGGGLNVSIVEVWESVDNDNDI